MGMLLTAVALVALAVYLKIQFEALGAYVDRERGQPAVNRPMRPKPVRRPRHIRTGRLARLGYRHHRERADRAYA